MQLKILCYQKRIYLYLPLNLNIATGVFLPWDYSARTKTKHLADGCSRYLLSIIVLLRPQVVNTLFIVRLRPNMSMRRAVIINYFLVHKMEVENLILLSTQVLLRSNEVSLAKSMFSSKNCLRRFR